MPNWRRSRPAVPLPPDWDSKVKPRILARDLHRCQVIRQDTGRRCLARAIEVDHITPRAEGGTDRDSNLQAICTWHHKQKTGREGGVASGRARRAKRDAAKPIHPGLLDPAQSVKRELAHGPSEEPPPF